jgi:hypothetical protein
MVHAASPGGADGGDRNVVKYVCGSNVPNGGPIPDVRYRRVWLTPGGRGYAPRLLRA